MAPERRRDPQNVVLTRWQPLCPDDVLAGVVSSGGSMHPGMVIAGNAELLAGEERIYFNARWYDPELGRFVSEDPIMDGENWYAYCENNPLTHTDPTGLIIKGLTSNLKMNEGEWADSDETLGISDELIEKAGCTVTAWTNIINTESQNRDETPSTVGGSDSSYMDDSDIDRQGAFQGLTGSDEEIQSVRNTSTDPHAVFNKLKDLTSSSDNYYVTGIAKLTYVDASTGKKVTVDHEVNIVGATILRDGTLSVLFQGTSTNDDNNDNRIYGIAPDHPRPEAYFQIYKLFYVRAGE